MQLALIVTEYSELPSHDRLNADLIYELRIDKDPSLLDLYDQLDPELKIILTLRSSSEGGDFDGERDKILEQMIDKQPTYIDLEVQRDLGLLELIKNSVPVLSLHDYSSTATESALEFLNDYPELQGRNDIVVKFVTQPKDSYDMIKAVSLLQDKFPRHVILGVGSQGILSRTLARDFSQEFVFGTKSENTEIPHYSMLQDALSSHSLLTGLLGKTLDHSLSPLIHELFRKSEDRAGYYHLFEVQDQQNIEDFLEYLSNTSVEGINVTYPYKSIVTRYCELDSTAERSGAANTIVFADSVKAYNTDITGFGKFFAGIDISKQIQSAVIIGAGGAAKAVALALLDRGIDLIIVNRSEDRLQSLPEEISNNATLKTLKEVNDILEVDLYVNATTVGYDDKSPANILKLPKKAKLVIDLNYKEDSTVLVREAQNRGIDAYDGKGMLFHQAADAYEIWTDHTLDREHLYNEFVRRLYG